MRLAPPMACLLAFLLLLGSASLAGCSRPQPPDEERRPEPQAAPAQPAANAAGNTLS